MTNGENGDGGGDLKGLGIAATAVVGVLAAVGVAGDLVPRMVRNDPLLSFFPLAFAILAALWVALVGPLEGRRPIQVAAVVFCLALIGAALIGVGSQSARENPGVSLVMSRTDKDRLVLDAKASGTSLRSNERMLLRVLAVRGSSRAEIAPTCRSGAFDVRSDARLLSWTETGPNAKGEATTEVTAEVPAKGFRYYCAYVALSARRSRFGPKPEFADRNSWAVVALPPA